MSERQFERFLDATLREDTATMVAMLDAGFDVNTANHDGETAFSYCCANNKLVAARFLTSRDANINSVDFGGATPLDWAVCWSSPGFREWLISIGGVRNSAHEPWPWPPPDA